MDNDVERLNRLLDDLAAEHSPTEHDALSPELAELAQTAAFLKGASPRSEPSKAFLQRLGTRLSTMQAPKPEATQPTADVSRRRLLGRLIAGVAGLATGTAAGELARERADQVAAASAYEQGKQDGYHDASTTSFSTPMVPHDRGEWIATGQTVDTVLPGQAIRFRAGAVEGFLVNPGVGSIYALSAACTHMGCLVSWLEATGTFLCPCHGAQYDADGVRLSGIARRPLPRLTVRADAHGALFVWTVTPLPAVQTLAHYAEK